ncbi:MAG TPA: periplasmic heavy metal sensor [Gemmatimonadales bacterium]|nr:periplasmic heavy metal sensor [Gemmatimonadales bacterium]
MFNKSKAWAVTLLAAVAAVGIAAGAVGNDWYAARHGCNPDRGTYSGYLTAELKLDHAQHDTVVAILRRHRPEMRLIMLTVRPRLDSVRARVADEIRVTLTPAQREAYQRLLDRDRAERARSDSTAAAQSTKP